MLKYFQLMDQPIDEYIMREIEEVIVCSCNDLLVMFVFNRIQRRRPTMVRTIKPQPHRSTIVLMHLVLLHPLLLLLYLSALPVAVEVLVSKLADEMEIYILILSIHQFCFPSKS